jgi:ubiquinone/menaquinone biosynthesis C-methylase UbiE
MRWRDVEERVSAAARDGRVRPNLRQDDQYERLIQYYEDAGPDFEEWSPAFNMHFGFYRRGLSPFRREPMLDEMNRQVVDRLRLPPEHTGTLVDLGCGVGATIRYAAAALPRASVVGITVVPWQVEKGNTWNQQLGLYPRARLELADYTRTPFAGASLDGALAIESACHAGGLDKDAFIREAARILKPGARLAVADGFLKHTERPLDLLSSKLHDALCRSFVLPALGYIELFVAALERHGFDDIVVDDVSWRVAPSALHAPVAVIWFAGRKLLRGERLRRQSVNNLKGSVLSTVLGANRWKFGYYLVSARKSAR